MFEALVVGLIGSSALVLGGALGSRWTIPEHMTGVLLAFASGTLIAALAFELFPEAVHVGGLGPSTAGLFVGAAGFVVANTVLDSRVAAGAGDPDEVPAPDPVSEAVAGAQADQRQKLATAARGAGTVAPGVAFGLLAAVTLDGVPENLALGVSLASSSDEGVAGIIALLVAIFVSNFPESLVGAVAMRSEDRSPRFVIGIWTITAVALTVAVIVGRGVAEGMSPGTLAFALAFAGGAVLASLADTLMPEAFEHGRPFNAMSTALGFLLAFVLSDL
ncbi:ZIP family zinc transporter [soil metagenome]